MIKDSIFKLSYSYLFLLKNLLIPLYSHMKVLYFSVFTITLVIALRTVELVEAGCMNNMPIRFSNAEELFINMLFN